MMKTFEQALTDAVWAAHSLFERGKTSGSSANISFRWGDSVYISASGTCFGTLKESEFVELDLNGNVIGGGKPSKEYPMHLMLYGKSDDIRAVIHTHGPYSVLWSCRKLKEGEPVIPRYTPYLGMKVGTVTSVPYAKPGSNELFEAFCEVLHEGDAFLLKNHGGVTAGKDMMDAFYQIEELEESARIAYLTLLKPDEFELIAD